MERIHVFGFWGIIEVGMGGGGQLEKSVRKKEKEIGLWCQKIQ